jgi:uncharacterized protein YndB with AHSA1/START domain
MRDLTQTLIVGAPAAAVMDAFFDERALAAWWGATRSLCMPRLLGSYAIVWDAADRHDELLGPLGGAFRGVVMDFIPGREFFVADAYWLPDSGDPIGPMAFEVRCTDSDGGSTSMSVRQSGWDDSPRWTRYYEVLGRSLPPALERLKQYVEQRR